MLYIPPPRGSCTVDTCIRIHNNTCSMIFFFFFFFACFLSACPSCQDGPKASRPNSARPRTQQVPDAENIDLLHFGLPTPRCPSSPRASSHRRSKRPPWTCSIARRGLLMRCPLPLPLGSRSCSSPRPLTPRDLTTRRSSSYSWYVDRRTPWDPSVYLTI